MFLYSAFKINYRIQALLGGSGSLCLLYSQLAATLPHSLSVGKGIAALDDT